MLRSFLPLRCLICSLDLHLHLPNCGYNECSEEHTRKLLDKYVSRYEISGQRVSRVLQ